jgi:hypothetical protein
MKIRWVIIACLSIILTGCAGTTGESQFKRNATKATYPGHGDQEIDISALAKVDLGLVDWAEITGEQLEKKIFLGFREGEESDYGAITLLPGRYQFSFGSDFSVSILLVSSGSWIGEVNYPTIYVEAGHTYRLHMDRSTGSLPIHVYGSIYDVTLGEWIDHRCLSEKGELLSRVRALAESGDANAQYLLGKWHQTGKCNGAEKNFSIAIDWLNKSATQGIVEASLELAKIYEYGTGGERNLDKALKWYEQAATQGNPYASSKLGYFYRTGKGVEKNLEQSLEWYQKAEDQGYSNAIKNIESVKEELACTKDPSCTNNNQTE